MSASGIWWILKASGFVVAERSVAACAKHGTAVGDMVMESVLRGRECCWLTRGAAATHVPSGSEFYRKPRRQAGASSTWQESKRKTPAAKGLVVLVVSCSQGCFCPPNALCNDSTSLHAEAETRRILYLKRLSEGSTWLFHCRCPLVLVAYVSLRGHLDAFYSEKTWARARFAPEP